MNCPKITADLDKLRYNAKTVIQWCHAAGVSVAFVSKSVCADPSIVEAVEGCGVDLIADSRIENLRGIKTRKPRMLLRIGQPEEAEEIVRCAEISLQSEVAAIRALGRAAARTGAKHNIILMIDLGDLREGVYFADERGILDTADAIVREPALVLYGLGTNLTCFGGIIPDEKNLGRLAEIAQVLRHRFGLPIPVVSGGNSSSLGLMNAGRLPSGVNNLRIGEAILLGKDTATGKPFPALFTDVFTLTAQLVELKQKPSKPVGKSMINAFGEKVSFRDQGPTRRGILAIGRQDTDAGGLTPRDRRVIIMGDSSDHLLVNLNNASDAAVGNEISFGVNYGALLRAFTSRYVKREYTGLPEYASLL